MSVLLDCYKEAGCNLINPFDCNDWIVQGSGVQKDGTIWIPADSAGIRRTGGQLKRFLLSNSS